MFAFKSSGYLHLAHDLLTHAALEHEEIFNFQDWKSVSCAIDFQHVVDTFPRLLEQYPGRMKEKREEG